MNVALRTTMTLAQFLAWEERQELRHEFDGARTYAMTGGTAEHAAIQRNVIIALGNRLRGKPCQVYGSELKILVAGSIRYPDAVVICTPLPQGATVVTEPVVVIEMLSKSTAHNDMMVKNVEYRATPSVQRYIILEQTDAGALVFSRKGGDWIADPVQADGVLAMPELGIEVPLAEFYIDVAVTGEAEAKP